MIDINKIVSCADAIIHDERYIQNLSQSFIDELKSFGFKNDPLVDGYYSHHSIKKELDTIEKYSTILMYRFIVICIYRDKAYLGFYKEPRTIYFEKQITIDDKTDHTETIISFLNNNRDRMYIAL